MEPKTVAESAINTSQIMTPLDVNSVGNVHGGVIMRLVDTTAALVAMRHSRCNVVTASVDRLEFHDPVFVGDLVTFKASINLAGRTSMEVGVRVEREQPLSGEHRHVASAYLTMVAMEEGKPHEIPPLVVTTDAEKRRNREAAARREVRLKERQQT